MQDPRKIRSHLQGQRGYPFFTAKRNHHFCYWNFQWLCPQTRYDHSLDTWCRRRHNGMKGAAFLSVALIQSSALLICAQILRGATALPTCKDSQVGRTSSF